MIMANDESGIFCSVCGEIAGESLSDFETITMMLGGIKVETPVCKKCASEQDDDQ